MSILTYGQGYAGNLAIGTPMGGGTFPAPGREFTNSGFTPDDSEVPPSAYGAGGVISSPGPGAGWNGILQQLALLGGAKLVDRLFGGDSRSTKAGNVPKTAVTSGAIPVPGFIDAPLSKPDVISPEAGTADSGFPLSPLLLAASAGLILLLLFVRR